MKVSVVILNWNGCDMLRTFLPSVVRYSKGEGTQASPTNLEMDVWMEEAVRAKHIAKTGAIS